MSTLIQNLNEILDTKNRLGNIIEDNGRPAPDEFNGYPDALSNIINNYRAGAGGDTSDFVTRGELSNYITADQLRSLNYVDADTVNSIVYGSGFIRDYEVDEKIQIAKDQITNDVMDLTHGMIDSTVYDAIDEYDAGLIWTGTREEYSKLPDYQSYKLYAIKK